MNEPEQPRIAPVLTPDQIRVDQIFLVANWLCAPLAWPHKFALSWVGWLLCHSMILRGYAVAFWRGCRNARDRHMAEYLKNK